MVTFLRSGPYTAPLPEFYLPMPQEAVPVLFFHASNDNLHQLQVWLHPAHIYFFLYFSSYSDKIVLHLQKWLYFIIHCVSTHYYLFIFWFVNRVSLVPGQSRHATGGEKGHNQLTPPRPTSIFLSLFLLLELSVYTQLQQLCI